MGQICGGSTIFCGSITFSTACEDIVGCSYDYGTGQCTGFATCTAQGYTLCPTEFCSPETGCSGTPTPCEQLSPSQCQMTAGCRLQ
jgi:hypothetical protein